MTHKQAHNWLVALRKSWPAGRTDLRSVDLTKQAFWRHYLAGNYAGSGLFSEGVSAFECRRLDELDPNEGWRFDFVAHIGDETEVRLHPSCSRLKSTGQFAAAPVVTRVAVTERVALLRAAPPPAGEHGTLARTYQDAAPSDKLSTKTAARWLTNEWRHWLAQANLSQPEERGASTPAPAPTVHWCHLCSSGNARLIPGRDPFPWESWLGNACLLYTSDAADE